MIRHQCSNIFFYFKFSSIFNKHNILLYIKKIFNKIFYYTYNCHHNIYTLSSKKRADFCAFSCMTLLSKPVFLQQSDVWGCTENRFWSGRAAFSPWIEYSYYFSFRQIDYNCCAIILYSFKYVIYQQILFSTLKDQYYGSCALLLNTQSPIKSYLDYRYRRVTVKLMIQLLYVYAHFYYLENADIFIPVHNQKLRIRLLQELLKRAHSMNFLLLNNHLLWWLVDTAICLSMVICIHINYKLKLVLIFLK
ncbi:hypothetical protein AGLY_010829 [Aphis glycines]|uniref:Uncharacterized protein n=1 Tax=Aphis glycines TaxID=307491 RepID=A0A6G0TGW6_APHGL|nr:hypothetical protein AGLY_010829 [Aphis glycines]